LNKRYLKQYQLVLVSANVRSSTILIQKMIENTHETTKQTTTSTIDKHR